MAHDLAPPQVARGSLIVGRVGLAVAGLAASSILMHATAPLTGDVSWLITVCERLLAGQRLYADIFELNPPMSAWLYLPWVWLAHAVGAEPELVIVLAMVGFAMAMIGASGRMLASNGLLESRGAWWIVGMLAFTIYPIVTFAQREHVAVLAALPILAAITMRATGREPSWPEAMLAGLCAGLALSIKPHFALGIALPVLFAAARRRSIRPLFAAENIVAGAVATLYLATIYLTQPVYFAEMLPIAGRFYVPNRLPLLILVLAPHAVILTATMATLWIARREDALRPLMLVLGWATLGFAGAYLIQARGWPYHLLPASLLALLAFGLAAASRRPYPSVLHRGLTLGLAAYLLVSPFSALARWHERDEPLRAALSPLGDRLTIGLISGDLSLGSPLHRTLGATLVNRGPSLWIAGNAFAMCGGAGAAPPEICREASEMERRVLREDLTRNPPDVILVEATYFDWAAWAVEDAEIAQILAGYELLEVVRTSRDTVRVLRRVASR
jgi:hypothetical protein